ncbi:UDP-N-acetylglucosamine 1-carboxyvinyltransferase, partial [Vibrio parahaemolyticus VPTS-2010_2]
VVIPTVTCLKRF